MVEFLDYCIERHKMILIVEGLTRAEDAQSLRNTLLAHADITEVRAGEDLASAEPIPNVAQIFLSYPKASGDLATDRMTDLKLAAKGARYWGPSLDEKYATYAGPTPVTGGDFHNVTTDLVYAANRKAYFDAFGVQYSGSPYVSPKTFVVVDHKRNVDPQDINEDPKLKAFMGSLSDDFWGSMMIISTQSSKKLETILEENDQTIPITTSTRTSAKVKFAGMDAVETSLPSEASSKYGISLRASVTMFERYT